jgi:hypothetical protein
MKIVINESRIQDDFSFKVISIIILLFLNTHYCFLAYFMA